MRRSRLLCARVERQSHKKTTQYKIRLQIIGSSPLVVNSVAKFGKRMKKATQESHGRSSALDSKKARDDSRAALLLRPGRNHAVGARVRDRLPQMLVLIFENQHQRVLLRHVFSEQFHVCLQVVVGKSRDRFL